MSEELARLPIVEELGAQLVAGFRRREGRRLRWPALRLAALSTAAAAGTAIVLATQIGGATSAAQAATRVLQSAAARLEANPPPAPRRGQFLFVRWRIVYLTSVRAAAERTIGRVEMSAPEALVTATQWGSWSATRAGETSASVLAVSFPTAAARTLWTKLGRPRLVTMAQGTAQRITRIESIPIGNTSLTIAQLRALPANARVIAARLFAGQSAANVISEIPNLEAFPIRSRVRAAIYRALTLVPGISFVGRARTLNGRVGVAIGTPDGVVRNDLIINPRDGSLLGSRTVVIDPRRTGLRAGTVYWQETLVQRVITNTPGPPRAAIVDRHGRTIAKSAVQRASGRAIPTTPAAAQAHVLDPRGHVIAR